MTAEIQKIERGEITLDDVRDKIIAIRDKNVLLDSDVAWLYGVETKRVNEAVNNNPDKFPAGYIIPLDKEEWKILKSKISTSGEEEKSLRSKISTLERQGRGQHTKYIPKAFTEKGLYMLCSSRWATLLFCTTKDLDVLILYISEKHMAYPQLV